MATIQLDNEVLAVEALIDAEDHDESFRQLILLKDRYGRRPEFRYLQALFDAKFKVRTARELIAPVIALVGEQPDFTEAIALLAQLYRQIDDLEKAEVFAREALRSKNFSARKRARDVLGLPPEDPNAEPDDKRRPSGVAPLAALTPPPSQAATPSAVASESDTHGGAGKLPPVVMPGSGATPSPEAASVKRSTREFFPIDPHAERAPTPAPNPPSSADGWELPPVPPAGTQRTTLDALKVPPPAPAADEGAPGEPLNDLANLPPPIQDSQEVPTVRHGSAAPSPMDPDSDTTDRFQLPPPPEPDRDISRFEHATYPAMKQTRPETPSAVETIQFAPVGGSVPPPPTIPPEAFEPPTPRSAPHQKEAPTARSRRQLDVPVEDDFRHPSEPPTRKFRGADPHHDPKSEPRVVELSGEGTIDRTGIDRTRRQASSRPAMAIPPSIEVQRQWFRYARANQVQRPQGDGEQFSTAATLIDLAERVVEGTTPLADQPIPLDRRGLIQVEQRLEVFRRASRPSQAATERAAVTAAAAFLLALLLKECDGRAMDTSAEDGACKVTLPGGATVRPLLVAAAYARSRGPGLVETFDRAATAHMRRSPTRPGRASEPVDRRPTQPPVARDSDLTVLRRDLDAGTLAILNADVPVCAAPRTSMRAVATDFWASAVGREIASASRRVGSFTLADIDALERYAAKLHGPVGFAPPGTPWPWMPSEDIEESIFAWGAVVGEVLNSLYTGRWEADPGNPDDRLLFRVVLTGGVVAWPVAKVYLRFARGITHDLSAYIDVVGRVVGRQTLSTATWP